MSRGIHMTRAEAEAHQRKHNFLSLAEAVTVTKERKALKVQRSRMNGTETEYSLILEAMKRRGEINEWRFGAVKLAWGEDPETGKPMFYTADFTVWLDAGPEMTFLEIKGGYIQPQDWIRFKGARARWPRYRFELHQRREGEWKRLL